MKHITSIHNKDIRFIQQLQRKSKSRREYGLFIVEGTREIELCIKSDFTIKEIFLCEDIFNFNSVSENIPKLKKLLHKEGSSITTVTGEVYARLAYRAGTEGIIALVYEKEQSLLQLVLPENPLLLIAESPEKPGNLGALLRTADAAAVDAVIITNSLTDLFNPNVIRSSIGCLFTVPVYAVSSAECIDFLKSSKIPLYAATLQSSKDYSTIDYTTAAALAVGTEATGLSVEMREAATENIIIPMHGAIDSLNVSVSAAVLLFEARRQRA